MKYQEVDFDISTVSGVINIFCKAWQEITTRGDKSKFRYFKIVLDINFD